jgi:hypothetical protein
MATLINPGDVRTFKRGNGNAVVVGLGLWAARQGKWIHIHMTGPGDSHTTVSNNPDSVRFHRTLFRDLRRTLVRENCWPFGEDGAEVEQEEDSVARFENVSSSDREILKAPRFQPIRLRGDGPTASEIVVQDRARS